ncbi:MAG: ribosome maturation factor RimP [Endomicrobiia bacterium]|nr:MAG: ribosome maturation factor RimP [Endomicrobiia bacterium]
MRSRVREIENLLTPIAEKEKIEIVDVQHIIENGSWILRIFIDKSDCVTVNDCENVNRIFGSFLDGNNIFTSPYFLEVSSPGPNRVLNKEESFKRFTGNKVRIRTLFPVNNRRNFLGILLGFVDGKVKINDFNDGILEIVFSDIERANIVTDDMKYGGLNGGKG